MKTYLAVLAAGLVSGCYFDHDLRGNGVTVTQSRAAGDFLRVENRGSLDVVVREGDAPDVQVTLDENLQHRVRTFVVDGDTLVVETDGGFTSTGVARVEVHVPRLVALTQDGSGAVWSEGFEHRREDVKLAMKGSGSLRYCGAASTLAVELSGSGDMELCSAGEGMLEWADFSQEGSGHLTWNGTAKQVRALTDGSGGMTLLGATNRLEARLDGSGNIEAQGLRAVNVDLSSDGSGHVGAFVDGGGAVINVGSSGNVDLYGHALSVQVRGDGSGRVTWH